jgi:hypothetical protein
VQCKQRGERIIAADVAVAAFHLFRRRSRAPGTGYYGARCNPLARCRCRWACSDSGGGGRTLLCQPPRRGIRPPAGWRRSPLAPLRRSRRSLLGPFVTSTVFSFSSPTSCLPHHDAHSTTRSHRRLPTAISVRTLPESHQSRPGAFCENPLRPQPASPAEPKPSTYQPRILHRQVPTWAGRI